MDEIDERCKELLYLKRDIVDCKSDLAKAKADLETVQKYCNEAYKHTLNLMNEAGGVGFISTIVEGVEFWTAQGREVVEIVNEDELPLHYIKPVIGSTIDKVAILRDLKAGRSVNGAKKVRNENYLNMRVL